MTRPADTSALIDRHRAGEGGALDALLAHACDRLRRLASRMLQKYPDVRRWEQTDDVLQNALLRLCRALAESPAESPRHFYNLAALQIRRELLDLADRHWGAEGHGANHQTDRSGVALGRKPTSAEGPSSVAEWADFHRHVGRLADDEREVFDLLWYQGLDQKSAAQVLGVSVRTLKRRWQAARMAIARTCEGEMPE